MLTPEQKEMRRSGYGASQVASLVGVGPGKPIEIYEEKVLGPKPEDEDEESMLAARLGTMLEEPTAQEYARKTKTFLEPVTTLRHPTRPLALATPDRARFLTESAAIEAVRGAKARRGKADRLLDAEGLAGAERLVEVKTTASKNRREYGPAGTGQVPEDKAIQATWQMGVTGQKVVDLPVLFRGEWGVKFEIFTVSFNAGLFDGLYEAVERFHRDHVLEKKPPPVDGTERYDEFLRRAFPANTGPAVIASDEDEALMLQHAKLYEAYSRLKRLRHSTRQELVRRIGDAEGIVSASLGAITYRRAKDGSDVDWQRAYREAAAIAGLALQTLPPGQRLALEAQLKGIVPDATKTTPGSRRFLPKWKGDAALQLARLNLMLDSLEEGSDPGDDDAD